MKTSSKTNGAYKSKKRVSKKVAKSDHEIAIEAFRKACGKLNSHVNGIIDIEDDIGYGIRVLFGSDRARVASDCLDKIMTALEDFTTNIDRISDAQESVKEEQKAALDDLKKLSSRIKV